jgi:2-oxoglutarate ferredoxin oxidoreductase subunit beta
MAFEAQIHGLGSSVVELLSTCPTNWGLSPFQATKWLEEKMLPYYPIGDFKVNPILAEMNI